MWNNLMGFLKRIVFGMETRLGSAPSPQVLLILLFFVFKVFSMLMKMLYSGIAPEKTNYWLVAYALRLRGARFYPFACSSKQTTI